MNPKRIAAAVALVIAAAVLAVQFRIERRLTRLEAAPAPPQVATSSIPLHHKGPTESAAGSPADEIAGLAASHYQARTELAKLRAEVTRLRAEVAKSAAAESRRIERSGTSVDIDLSDSLIPTQERIERWDGGPKRSWGHEQAAGESDTLNPGDVPTAWASKLPDGGEEWLKLDYDRPVDLQQIRVFESHNPGAVSKVTALLPDGTETPVWEGTLDPSVADEVVASEFVVKNTIRAQSVKIYLDTTRVPGWNEIDAVQLIGRDGSRQWASASSSSSSYPDP